MIDPKEGQCSLVYSNRAGVARKLNLSIVLFVIVLSLSQPLTQPQPKKQQNISAVGHWW